MVSTTTKVKALGYTAATAVLLSAGYCGYNKIARGIKEAPKTQHSQQLAKPQANQEKLAKPQTDQEKLDARFKELEGTYNTKLAKLREESDASNKALKAELAEARKGKNESKKSDAKKDVQTGSALAVASNTAVGPTANNTLGTTIAPNGDKGWKSFSDSPASMSRIVPDPQPMPNQPDQQMPLQSQNAYQYTQQNGYPYQAPMQEQAYAQPYYMPTIPACPPYYAPYSYGYPYYCYSGYAPWFNIWRWGGWGYGRWGRGFRQGGGWGVSRYGGRGGYGGQENYNNNSYGRGTGRSQGGNGRQLNGNNPQQRQNGNQYRNFLRQQPNAQRFAPRGNAPSYGQVPHIQTMPHNQQSHAPNGGHGGVQQHSAPHGGSSRRR